MLIVTLLVTTNELENLAKEVQDILQTQFIGQSNANANGTVVIEVQVRSGSLSPERLIPCALAHKTQLFVVFGPENASSSYLQAYSLSPVLFLFSSSAFRLPHPVQVQADALALHVAKFCTLTSVSYSNNSNDDDSGRLALVESVRRAAQAAQQGALVQDAVWKSMSYLHTHIANCIDQGKQITGEGIAVANAQQTSGKVRDRWEPNPKQQIATTPDLSSSDKNRQILALVTTDRQSGFDRQLAVVPYKGAVLNLCSQFWFEETRDIIQNHLIATPHPCVSVVHQCQPFPIEFVVRSYMTGSTSTSIWKNYHAGVRLYCGHVLPEGMTKNQKLASNLLTPTTKEEDHDRPISLAEIVQENWMTQEDLDVCSAAALAVFARGQEIAAQHGLILVDTKYEFGRCCGTGEIMLIDEVHTPDSSRYWLANSYAKRISEGLEPENIDKEFLRLWFADRCDPYKDEKLPEAPRDLVMELSRRYIQLYEMITWNDFDFAAATTGEAAIASAIEKYFV